MATSYACDECGATGTTLEGWLLIGVTLMHWDPAMPLPTTGRVLDHTFPDLVFDKIECRDAWLAKIELVAPAQGGPT